ncbi:TonB-dependent receptor domain-containing protein [Rhodovulum steppense]|nr:TonB-dependent receptor [Rhodovulum steppense]
MTVAAFALGAPGHVRAGDNGAAVAPSSIAGVGTDGRTLDIVTRGARPGKDQKPQTRQTRAIYDPAGGQDGRNLPRPDLPLCANWRGGPRGTLLPAGPGGSGLPQPGRHGLIGLGYSKACERTEAVLQFSTRGDRFFARGTIYSEDVGAYRAPEGPLVRSDRERLSYSLGAGLVGRNGSFLSFDARRLERDRILFQGNATGADTRRFDVEGYDLAGTYVLDGSGATRLRVEGRFNRIDRINDNFSFRGPPPTRSEVRLDRETVDVLAVIDGGGAGFIWTLGIEYASDQRDGTRYQGPALTPQSPNYADARVASTALTAEGTWTLAPESRLKTGLRLDHVDARLGDIDRSGMLTGGGATPTPRQMFAATYGYGGEGRKSETNLGAGLRFERDFNGQQGQLFAGLTYTPRTADPRERYLTSFTPATAPQIFSTWIGNPDLDPERHAMLEVGGNTSRGPWTLAGRAYADWVEDFILWDRARGQAGVTRADNVNIYRNVDAFIAGLEAKATYRWDNGVWAGAEVWLTHGENTTDNRPIAQIPPAEAALKLGWKGKTISVEGTWHLVAKQSRLDNDFVTGSGADGDGRGGALAAGYGSLDLAANWSPRPNTILSLGVANVFDKDYIQLIERMDIDDPFKINPTAPGRSLWAGATIRF